MTETKLVDVTAANIGEHPQAICFINPKHEHFHHKVDWLKQQFKNGLQIKLLYRTGEKRAAGFIEYVPGEHSWRGVKAAGYLFIHCLMTHGKQHQQASSTCSMKAGFWPIAISRRRAF